VRFTLNGEEVDVDAHPMRRLLDVLREECGLTGTKEGCGEGECGACTVLVDDAPVCACLVPVAQVEDARVITIEGLGAPSAPHVLQRAFAELGAAQCGICTPGMILAAMPLIDLAKNGYRATLDDIRVALAGNLCRCTGYEAIYRAVERAIGEVA
jgi:carbon-monoxide dehydrogenase small subunit/xanthine dehydrogenase small subunit